MFSSFSDHRLRPSSSSPPRAPSTNRVRFTDRSGLLLFVRHLFFSWHFEALFFFFFFDGSFEELFTIVSLLLNAFSSFLTHPSFLSWSLLRPYGERSLYTAPATSYVSFAIQLSTCRSPQITCCNHQSHRNDVLFSFFSCSFFQYHQLCLLDHSSSFSLI